MQIYLVENKNTKNLSVYFACDQRYLKKAKSPLTSLSSQLKLIRKIFRFPKKTRKM